VVPARDRFVRLATDHAFDYELRRAPELRDPTTGAYPAGMVT